MCATGEGWSGWAGPLHVYHFKKAALVYGPILLYLKLLAWRGNLDRRSGLQQDNTPHGQLGGGRWETGVGWGLLGVGIWDCLNKSVRNISHWGHCRRCCWFVPPCRRGIRLPLRDHLIIGRKTERKSVLSEGTCVIAPSAKAFWQITAVAGI